MLREEWKKRMARGGLVLLICVVLAQFAFTALNTRPYNSQLEREKLRYEACLSRVEGPLTPENRLWIEEEMTRLNRIHSALEMLRSDYYTGQISLEDFQAQYPALMTQDQDFSGFSHLYTQYIYVRGADNRYFLYTGGWEVLLGDWEADHLLLLGLIFLLAPIFCQEYGCGMDQLLLTQKKSAYSQWRAKLVLALMISLFLVTAQQLFEICYCALRFGLPHWDYPLQSLQTFGENTMQLRLWQALGLQYGLKLVGYGYCAVLLLAICVLVKKYALALMAGIGILNLPFLTVSGTEAFLRVPAPWALTVGSVYLKPSVVQQDFTGTEVTIFHAISWKELGWLLAGVAVILLVLVAFIHRKNLNFHCRKGLALLALVPVLLSGCAGEGEPVCFNSRDCDWFAEGSLVAYSEIDAILVDQQAKTYTAFPLDAFAGEAVNNGTAFFRRGDQVYYLRRDGILNSGGSPWRRGHHSLMALDVHTLEESIRYEWNDQQVWFFGLLKWTPTQTASYAGTPFFLHGDWLYYGDNDGIFRQSMTTGTAERYLTQSGANNFAYDGKSLYYTDAYGRLVIHDLDTQQQRLEETVVAQDFRLTPEGILYLNLQKNQTLHLWRFGDQPQQLDDTPAYQMWWDETYFWEATNQGLYRMDHNGENKVLVEYPGYVDAIPSGDYFYSSEYFEGKLYQIDKHTFQITQLEKR